MPWVRIAGFVIIVVALAAAWRSVLGLPLTPEALAAVVAPHRHTWYALPLVVIAFVALGLVLFPVLVLIAATGIAFGPLFGPIYAMAGSLASASAGFAIGRRLGRGRVERLVSRRLMRVVHTVRRNGTLAVFLLRKVPAPFTLVNIAVGASRVSFRDFVVGTLLGMMAAVVALAGFGSQLGRLVRDPSPAAIARAALFVAVPLGLALLINRALRARPAA